MSFGSFISCRIQILLLFNVYRSDNPQLAFMIGFSPKYTSGLSVYKL